MLNMPSTGTHGPTQTYLLNCTLTRCAELSIFQGEQWTPHPDRPGWREMDGVAFASGRRRPIFRCTT